MKTRMTFIILITFVGFISCSDNKEISTIPVDRYI